MEKYAVSVLGLKVAAYNLSAMGQGRSSSTGATSRSSSHPNRDLRKCETDGDWMEGEYSAASMYRRAVGRLRFGGIYMVLEEDGLEGTTEVQSG
jgi:hypothetical protein